MMILTYSRLLPSLLVAALCPSSLVQAACYARNGTDRSTLPGGLSGTSVNHVSCNEGGDAPSMCCNANDGDACIYDGFKKGLCFNQGANVLWRESCTDSSWMSPNCVKLFVNGSGVWEDIVITDCLDGSFCYGNGNYGCCSAKEGVFIINGVQSATNVTSSTTSASSSAISTTSTLSSTSSTTTTSPTASMHPNPGLSNGATIGIGVGVGCGVALLLIGAIIFWLRRRKGKPSASQSTASDVDGESKTFPSSAIEMGADTGKWRNKPQTPSRSPQPGYVELPNHDYSAELPHHDHSVELPT